MAKYSAKSADKVKTAMEEMKSGTLTSGRSSKKVTDPKQAIAIGLSEARAEGAQVPAPHKKSAAVKKTSPKKPAAKKSATAKKTAPKKSAGKATAKR